MPIAIMDKRSHWPFSVKKFPPSFPTPCELFNDRYTIYERVEEVKMLSDNIKEPLFDLDKCSLNELMNILQSFVNDPSFNVHQTIFGSYIANHVIKKRYNAIIMRL
jgi:hypothetical protein